MRLNLVTGPASEPLSLAEAKAQLVVDADVTADDALITSQIVAARMRAELETNRAFISQVWEVSFDAGFPPLIEVPRPPLITVDAITYVDEAGVSRVMDPSKYQVDAPAGPYAERGRIAPVYGETWPVTRPETFNAVVVRFTAGYGATAASVPEAIKAAMRLIVGHLYANREDVLVTPLATQLVALPIGASNLLVPFKSRPVRC
ncbi:MAG TPA: hypothetical protein VM364_08025 [Vicinamibacterales bacterium]|nr:hypothetical protein [Vicinamibacterales bacterium]